MCQDCSQRYIPIPIIFVVYRVESRVRLFIIPHPATPITPSAVRRTFQQGKKLSDQYQGDFSLFCDQCVWYLAVKFWCATKRMRRLFFWSSFYHRVYIMFSSFSYYQLINAIPDFNNLFMSTALDFFLLFVFSYIIMLLNWELIFLNGET